MCGIGRVERGRGEARECERGKSREAGEWHREMNRVTQCSIFEKRISKKLLKESSSCLQMTCDTKAPLESSSVCVMSVGEQIKAQTYRHTLDLLGVVSAGWCLRRMKARTSSILDVFPLSVWFSLGFPAEARGSDLLVRHPDQRHEHSSSNR